ncbi:hypothetical protein EDB83DRAFT_1278312 [Lactarius deliciosus]|nr:hypothetical protein EDB83DRAFT_1278312 [Lactarius deliciosus]
MTIKTLCRRATPRGRRTRLRHPTTLNQATQRVLRPHNFAKALKEITPSASESLGSLSDLRKWNDEFGEGRKRKKQVWGKDRFGFTKQWHTRQDGRVATPTGSNESNSTPSAG